MLSKLRTRDLVTTLNVDGREYQFYDVAAFGRDYDRLPFCLRVLVQKNGRQNIFLKCIKQPSSKYFATIACFLVRLDLLLYGVDVLITIFCHLCQLSAKKIGVLLKNQCHGNKKKPSCSLSMKRQYFRQIFRQKYLKNNNIGPISFCYVTTLPLTKLTLPHIMK
jgi:hypothetical protein